MEKRKTVRDIAVLKGERPIVSLTSYTAPIARVADKHADLILVGDSLGMVLYGMGSTIPVTLDLMINHGRAVVASTKKAMVIVDMPFGSYQESPEQAYRNAARLMQETGCCGVKIEGGSEMAATISFMTQRGVPVLGHIGLQPQSVNSAGGYRVFGRSAEEEKKLLDDANAVEEAGAFSVVLECTTAEIAGHVSKNLKIPTIGIGASALCDGQILVTEDLLGLSGDTVPKFVKQYAGLSREVDQALVSYADDVKSGTFPGKEHSYQSGKLYAVSSEK